MEERTTYYVRAYAINSLGTGYGQVDTLTTLAVPVVVTTTPPDSVWSTGIISGGEVLSDGGRSVIRRGVCWSSTALPDVSLSTRTTDGSDVGEFTSKIVGLEHDSVYYVRAYGTNNLGTGYGEVDTIRTAAGCAGH